MHPRSFVSALKMLILRLQMSLELISFVDPPSCMFCLDYVTDLVNEDIMIMTTPWQRMKLKWEEKQLINWFNALFPRSSTQLFPLRSNQTVLFCGNNQLVLLQLIINLVRMFSTKYISCHSIDFRWLLHYYLYFSSCVSFLFFLLFLEKKK